MSNVLAIQVLISYMTMGTRTGSWDTGCHDSSTLETRFRAWVIAQASEGNFCDPSLLTREIRWLDHGDLGLYYCPLLHYSCKICFLNVFPSQYTHFFYLFFKSMLCNVSEQFKEWVTKLWVQFMEGSFICPLKNSQGDFISWKEPDKFGDF